MLAGTWQFLGSIVDREAKCYHIRVMLLVVYIFFALAGMAIGWISGCIISLITRSGQEGVVFDILLGIVGFLGGFIACGYIPWPPYWLIGGTRLTSTMDTYGHPLRPAIVLAILLPVLHEIYRAKPKQTN